MKHLKTNIIAALDFETTGTDPKTAEIIQIAVVPLGNDLLPLKEAFYTLVRPEHPESADPAALVIHGITLEELEEAPDATKVADLLYEWVRSLKLPVGGKVIPLVHNYPFEYGFLTAWLGASMRDELFHYHPRDAMTFALGLNDRAALKGEETPFASVGLLDLCQHFHVTNPNPHDALYDSLTEATIYRELLLL